MAELPAREAMDVDVVIVGAGPAGLAAAIRLKQIAPDAAVLVVEKGSEVGAHILSGAVIDPIALDRLLPEWRKEETPIKQPVTADQFYWLGQSRALRLPNWPMPPLMSNHGNFIVSLGNVCRWLAQKAEALGVDIYPGFAAAEPLYGANGEVVGVAAPQLPDDVQELARAAVPVPLAEMVAEPPLLHVVAAGHHVEQQAAPGDALVGGRHLGGQRRRQQAGPERDEELEALGDLAEPGRHDPGVLAPRAGRGERAGEAELLGRAGDLPHVADVGRPLGTGLGDPAAGRADRVPEAQVGARVAVGRQEPVQDDTHIGMSIKSIDNMAI